MSYTTMRKLMSEVSPSVTAREIRFAGKRVAGIL
jgi:hypothetical protein